MNGSIALALLVVVVVVTTQAQVRSGGGRGNFVNRRVGASGRNQNRFGTRAQRRSGYRNGLSARTGW